MKQRIKCATLITTDNLKMNHACIFSRLNQVGDKISNIKKEDIGFGVNETTVLQETKITQKYKLWATVRPSTTGKARTA